MVDFVLVRYAEPTEYHVYFFDQIVGIIRLSDGGLFEVKDYFEPISEVIYSEYIPGCKGSTFNSTVEKVKYLDLGAFEIFKHLYKKGRD